MKIIEQWKRYTQWIHYNIVLKKKFKNLEKEIKEKENKVKELTGDKRAYIGAIRNLKNPEKSLKLYLYSKQIMKKNFLHNLIEKIFKFDGYIFHYNKGNDLNIYKVKNLGFLKNIKNKELYNLHEKEGTFKGKPFYVVKYPYAISLNVKESGELFYDTEAYYNYVNRATKINLTNLGEKFNLAQFVKQNFMLILIAIGLVLLFTTPEGKEFLQGILPK